MAKSTIKVFGINGRMFTHEIDTETDDIQCIDEDGNVVLAYTWNCWVLDKDGKRIARVGMETNKTWSFEPCDGKAALSFASRHVDLLRAEVEYSIYLLEKNLGDKDEHTNN